MQKGQQEEGAGNNNQHGEHYAAAKVVSTPRPEDEESSAMTPGIPWVLPPEREHVPERPAATTITTAALPWAVSVDSDDNENEEEEEEQEGEEEEDVAVHKNTIGGDPFKMHPDRLKRLSGGSGSDVRRVSNSNSKGSRAKSGAKLGKVGKVGGKGNRGTEQTGADALQDEAGMLGEDELKTDGYYGPRADVPPCTVFTPLAGKIRRIGESTALVVGLDAGERLCFVGAARVRCCSGLADLSGYALRPVPRGPYVEAHSPRWMSLLVIRAAGVEDHPDMEALSSLYCNEEGAAAWQRAVDRKVGGEDDRLEGEVEKVVDEIAENFPVVVALRPLSDLPLNFLTAQADADSLYAADLEAHAISANSADTIAAIHADKAVAGESESGSICSLAAQEMPPNPRLNLAGELRLPGMQVVVSEAAGLCPFSIPQDSAEVVDSVVKSPFATERGLVLVCGAKGVGKSTFCRFLVNRLLGRYPQVAYMDCDLGQPEFTAPGLLSLHRLEAPVVGPPHANIRRPELAFFVGTTTSKTEPLLYSAAVRALVEQYAAAGRDSASLAAGGTLAPPLVVNTDGWVKGMGEDLLGAVIDAVRPHHIVQILGASQAKKFDLARVPDGCYVHRVGAYSPPPPPVGGSPAPSLPTAQELRTLRLVAYFLGRGGSGDAVGTWDEAHTAAVGEKGREESAGCEMQASDWHGGATLRAGVLYDKGHGIAALLAAKRPRRVPWRAVKIRVMTGAVPPNLILHAINGALVGLVASPEPWRGEADDNKNSNGGVHARGEGLLACLAETPLAPCVGLGLVRSVDVERRVLYVLTPEPVEVLKRVNVLVKGAVQLPNEMVFDPSFCSQPYFSSEVVAGEVLKNRSYMFQRGGGRQA